MQLSYFETWLLGDPYLGMLKLQADHCSGNVVGVAALETVVVLAELG